MSTSVSEKKVPHSFTTVRMLIYALSALSPDAIVTTNAMDGDMLEFFPIRLPLEESKTWVDMNTGLDLGTDDEDQDENPEPRLLLPVVRLIADS
jgi:hypothetical protein